MSCGVSRSRGLDPELLRLWCRPAAKASIRPLAWEPPYAARVAKGKAGGEARERRKKNKNASLPETHPADGVF